MLLLKSTWTNFTEGINSFKIMMLLVYIIVLHINMLWKFSTKFFTLHQYVILSNIIYIHIHILICIYAYVYILIEHDSNIYSVQQETDFLYSAFSSVLLLGTSKMFLKVVSLFVRCDVTEFLVCYLEEIFQSA